MTDRWGVACPGDHELSAWVEARRSGTAVTALEQHVTTCATCRRRLSALARVALASRGSRRSSHGSVDSELPPAPLRRGSLIGRYVIIDVVGGRIVNLR